MFILVGMFCEILIPQKVTKIIIKKFSEYTPWSLLEWSSLQYSTKQILN
jgi:hypothetical protein